MLGHRDAGIQRHRRDSHGTPAPPAPPHSRRCRGLAPLSSEPPSGAAPEAPSAPTPPSCEGRGVRATEVASRRAEVASRREEVPLRMAGSCFRTSGSSFIAAGSGLRRGPPLWRWRRRRRAAPCGLSPASRGCCPGPTAPPRSCKVRGDPGAAERACGTLPGASSRPCPVRAPPSADTGPVPSSGPSSSLSRCPRGPFPVSPAPEESSSSPPQVTPRCWPGCTAPRR